MRCRRSRCHRNPVENGLCALHLRILNARYRDTEWEQVLRGWARVYGQDFADSIDRWVRTGSMNAD